MNPVTNEELRAIVLERRGTETQAARRLLPLAPLIKDRTLSLDLLANALVESGTVEEALAETAANENLEGLSAAEKARASLLRINLEKAGGLRSDSARESRHTILTHLCDSLDYYRPSRPDAIGALRPTRVEITSPMRIDLGMGGLSDLPPWTNERPGGSVSLCANIGGVPPMHCAAYVTSEPVVQLLAVGRGSAQTVSSWAELEDHTTQTGIARTCLLHFLAPTKHDSDLLGLVVALFGGGLHIQTTSTAPKGFGSSSILSSLILQALLRLMGQPIDGYDLIHRYVTTEHMMGVRGGWEDGLAAFHGGAVLAESTPCTLPIVRARRLRLADETVAWLEQRLVVFDTEQQGYTGAVLSEGSVRYLSGDPLTLRACQSLVDLARQVSDVLERGSVEYLGPLLSQQWDAWKTVTNGVCTTESIDRLILGAQPWVEGAKVSGAGSGGAVLFVTKVGQRRQLLEYLAEQTGSLVAWQPDMKGYQIREWYDPRRVGSCIQDLLPGAFREKCSQERHGELLEFQVDYLPGGENTAPLVGPVGPAVFDLVADLPLAVFATAMAIGGQVGAAKRQSPTLAVRMMDATASAVFSEELEHWSRAAPVCVAEAKDAQGDPSPGVRTTTSAHRDELSTAVDVVDGTALAAAGLPGAYSLCAVANRLQAFPDLQAYALLAPELSLPRLDLSATPESAVNHNMAVVASALGKRIDELIVVTHSNDTGAHHGALIERMRSLGISVVVPERVIVETPFVLAACLNGRWSFDAMIGVFGLPETIINTILCGTLRRGLGFVFRLASNLPLQNREQQDLAGVFDLSPEESAEALALGLDPDACYTLEKVCSEASSVFAAAAITEDPLLGLAGVSRAQAVTSVQGLLADPCGNVHRLSASFRRPSEIDYLRRYELPLFDISVLLELDSSQGGASTIGRIGHLATRLRGTLPGCVIGPIHRTHEGFPGLHVTLFEFTVEYSPTSSPQEQELAFTAANAAVAAAFRDLRGPQTVHLGKVIRGPSVLLMETRIEKSLEIALAEIPQYITDFDLFNSVSCPQPFHMTIARFTEVLFDDALMALDRILDEFNETPCEPFHAQRLIVHKIARTVQGDTRETSTLFLPA